LEFITNCLPQVQISVYRGITKILSLIDGFFGALADMGRGFKIGLSQTQGNNFYTL
jgi:hypothetical protein